MKRYFFNKEKSIQHWMKHQGKTLTELENNTFFQKFINRSEGKEVFDMSDYLKIGYINDEFVGDNMVIHMNECDIKED